MNLLRQIGLFGVGGEKRSRLARKSFVEAQVDETRDDVSDAQVEVQVALIGKEHTHGGRRCSLLVVAASLSHAHHVGVLHGEAETAQQFERVLLGGVRGAEEQLGVEGVGHDALRLDVEDGSRDQLAEIGERALDTRALNEGREAGLGYELAKERLDQQLQLVQHTLQIGLVSGPNAARQVECRRKRRRTAATTSRLVECVDLGQDGSRLSLEASIARAKYRLHSAIQHRFADAAQSEDGTLWREQAESRVEQHARVRIGCQLRVQFELLESVRVGRIQRASVLAVVVDTIDARSG